MVKQYAAIPERFQHFMQEQKLFFVATATAQGRVNLSPKGMDSLRILSRCGSAADILRYGGTAL